MQSAVETLTPTRVRLTVEADFAELKPELDKAYKTIGAQVRVQGFRPGKVPPRILDQRVGRGVVLEEAVQEAIPRLYGEAVTQAGVAPLGRPDVDVTEVSDGDRLAFTAEVDVRPPIDLPGYQGLSVTVDAAAVSDAEVEEQVSEMRAGFASLTPVEGPSVPGSFVELDLSAAVDGQQVPGGTASGVSYEVGSGDLLDGLDEAITGATAGDSRTFTTTLLAGEFEGQEAEVAVTVRAVNERQLPEVDDAFAESSGFESLAALRADVRGRLERVKRLQQGVEARDKVLETLLAQVEVPLPAAVVESEQDWRRQQTSQQLQQAGMTLDMYLEHEGKGAEQFESELREGAEQSVKSQLVLDAIADTEQLGVEEAELTESLVRRAQRAGVPPQEYASQLVQSGGLPGLISEVRRGKALAIVLQAATVRDTAGADVDLEALRESLAAPGDATPDDVEVDDDGRRFHRHPDGAVHYLDED